MPRSNVIVPQKDAPRWLYEILRHLGDNSRGAQASLDAIGRGEAPDGSGLPLIDTSVFVLLHGRPSGQVIHGATESGGKMTLVSTFHDTKGKVYFGKAETAGAFDEASGRFGFGTASPSVLVHVNTAALGTSTVGAYGTTYQRFSYAGTPLFDIRPILNNGGLVDAGIALVSGGFVINSDVGTEGLRFASASQRGFLQCGVLNSLGTPINKNLTIGGINATVATDVIINTTKTSIISTSGQFHVGINVNMNDFGGGGGPGCVVYVGTGPGGTVFEFPGSSTDDVLSIRPVASLASPNKAIEVEYIWRVTAQGRMWLSNAAGSAWYADAAGSGVTRFVTATDNIRLTVGPVLSWSDSVYSTGLEIGDTTDNAGPISRAVSRRVWLASAGYAIFDRFGIGSKYILLTDAQAGSADFLASTTTPLVRIYNSVTVADTALEVRGMSGQTGHLIDLSQNGTVRSWFAADGTLRIEMANGSGVGLTIKNSTSGGSLQNSISVLNAANAEVFSLGASGQVKSTTFILLDPVSGFEADFIPVVAGFTASSQIYVPDIPVTGVGTMVLGTDSGLTFNVTLGTTTRLIASTSATGASFSDTTTAGKRLRVVLSGAVSANHAFVFTQSGAGARLYGYGSIMGNVVIVGDTAPAVAANTLGKIDLTGQTAAIGSTNLSSTPPAGQYEIQVVAVCTTLSGSGAPTLDVTLAWTDVLGATTEKTINALSLSATGRTHGATRVQVASGNISYSTTINSASGSPQYALYIRVIYLG